MENISQSIWTNYMLEKDCWDKIINADQQFLKALENLNIKIYAPFCDRMVVVMIALSAESFSRKERLSYLSKKQKIEIYINMDYEKLLQATESETLQLIAQTYLSAISRFLRQKYSCLSKLFCCFLLTL
ncbi:MAG: hypothetical protein EAZ97_12135 [Bacteroidetes bacterium]|nr:MAG: hypothetical protein EAZ97_12135 [Bacteroidota bacterium]